MKKVKKIYIMIIVICLMITLSSCYVETDLKFGGNGSGQGTMKIVDYPIPQEEIREVIEGMGFSVTEIQTEGNTTTAKIKWERFSEIDRFKKFIKNSDGTTTIDLGSVFEMSGGIDGTVTVKVPGKIVKTQGRIVNKNTVIFTSGRIIVTYQPSNILIWIVLFVLSVISIFIVYNHYFRKNPH